MPARVSSATLRVMGSSWLSSAEIGCSPNKVRAVYGCMQYIYLPVLHQRQNNNNRASIFQDEQTGAKVLPAPPALTHIDRMPGPRTHPDKRMYQIHGRSCPCWNILPHLRAQRWCPTGSRSRLSPQDMLLLVMMHNCGSRLMLHVGGRAVLRECTGNASVAYS